MGIFRTELDRIMDAEQSAARANAKAAELQTIANIAFVRMAEEGLIAEEVAAEHAEVFEEVKPEEVIVTGALRKQVTVDAEGKEEVKLVRCIEEAAGKVKAVWETVATKQEIGNIELPTKPVGKQ